MAVRDDVRRGQSFDEGFNAEESLRLKAFPWSKGWLPDPEHPTETVLGRYYALDAKQDTFREKVAAQIARDVLSVADLYRDLPTVGEKLIPPEMTLKKNKVLKEQYENMCRSYDQTARNLEAQAPTAQASIRPNNRALLRLYLGDRLRDRSDQGIYVSVIWAEDQKKRLWIFAVALTIWLGCCFVNINTFSLQAFYRDHIYEQWLQGKPRAASPYLHEGLGTYRSKLAGGDDPPRRAPLLLINATLQGNRSIGIDPELHSHIFTFSPVGAGSGETGYWINRGDVKTSDTFARHNKLDLGQMVAISGAFLSPGQVANPAIAAILHLLNIRTGWWAQKNWQRDRLGKRILFHLLHSLGVDIDGDSRFPLTDGAHVENLGLKVLLDRRCSLIVASDCSQEDEVVGHRFGALIEVLRQAQVEGIEVGPFLSAKSYRHWLATGRFDEVGGTYPDCKHVKSWGLDLVTPPDPTEDKAADDGKPKAEAKPAEKEPSMARMLADRYSAQTNGDTIDPAKQAAVAAGVSLSQEHFLFARVIYPDKKEALLVYLRPTLTGDEGESLARPARDSKFPDDSPLDQFYTVARMNTYRLLGRHIGRELVEDGVMAEALRSVIRGGPAILMTKPLQTDRDRLGACTQCTQAKLCIAHVERGRRPEPSLS